MKCNKVAKLVVEDSMRSNQKWCRTNCAGAGGIQFQEEVLMQFCVDLADPTSPNPKHGQTLIQNVTDYNQSQKTR